MTTMLGFGSLVVSVFPGLVSMGLMVMTGRFVAMATALLVIPAAARRMVYFKGDTQP